MLAATTMEILKDIVILMIPVFMAAIAAYLEYLRQNQATITASTDRIEKKTDDQTVKIEDAHTARLEQTRIIVGAAKETERVVQKLTDSQLIGQPQEVVVVNAPSSPIPTVEKR